MHGQRTPSPPYSGTQFPVTPKAPYMYTQPLPPSPQTPSNRALPGTVPMPRAPYMGSVGLPPSQPSHYLPTPPTSPEKTRGPLDQTLMRGYAPRINLFERPAIPADVAQRPATPSACPMTIHIEHRAFSIRGSGPNGAATVGEVLTQLCTQWVQYRSQDEVPARMYTSNGLCIGDVFAHRGIYFVGLTASRLGPGHFDLHLSN
ncbi:hypothetical protein EIP91_007164 [Steccherinum ochraceum]|uniref:Uncharacterized protein n=1 Tax=Steccherinum ochraceum TaxID=92696 RepID=A0A4R0RLF0_9APHY|nr:hypothetical protein EIP91_007164 [Steccherinum ochraceum]